MRKEPKISYSTIYAPDGTVYEVRLNVSMFDFNRIQRGIAFQRRAGYPDKELYEQTPTYAQTFLKPLEESESGNIFYTNLTQQRFIFNLLGLPLSKAWKRNMYITLRGVKK